MKDAFAILGKRKALGPVAENVRPLKQRGAPNKGPSTTAITQLTQLQISLGQTVSKKCPICGMTYITSSAEDRKVHNKFHKQHVEGYEVGKNFILSLQKHDPDSVRYPPEPKQRKTDPSSEEKTSDVICIITSRSPPAHRRHAKSILSMVERDLGAVSIPENTLFTPNNNNNTYTFYLYMHGTQCIGFLLTEEISSAYVVIEPDTPTAPAAPGKGTVGGQMQNDSGGLTTTTSALAALKARHKKWTEEDTKPVSIGGEKAAARMGVSRIWTAPTHRGRDVARRLLDAAVVEYERQKRRNKGDGGTPKGLRETNTALRKDQVAFSHPTIPGTRLARKWFGRRYGWLVYVT